jgi:hypothetical protein
MSLSPDRPLLLYVVSLIGLTGMAYRFLLIGQSPPLSFHILLHFIPEVDDDDDKIGMNHCRS